MRSASRTSSDGAGIFAPSRAAGRRYHISGFLATIVYRRYFIKKIYEFPYNRIDPEPRQLLERVSRLL
jgi:hypothetical protein